MKVRVDGDLCSVCMTCVNEVPEVFEMGDDVAQAKVSEVPADLEDRVREIADECVAEAIIVE